MFASARSLFHSKLVCFFCGCKSAQLAKTGIRRWKCENCEAVNHLDENGEITEAPLTEPQRDIRYARPNPRSGSPNFEVSEGSLFCATCLKNQHLYSQILADYLPDPNASEYNLYERELPKFKARLEEQYPQICEACEPRISERIAATSYAAKCDHLRRMNERTQLRGVPKPDGNWKSVLVFFAGIAWALSWLAQMLWDALGILAYTQKDIDLIEYEPESTPFSCFENGILAPALTSDCMKLANHIAYKAILLGVLSSWWNPKIQEKLRIKKGSISGTSMYYQIQFILLIFRCSAWWYITRTSDHDLDLTRSAAMHSALLLLAGPMILSSFRCLQIVDTARRLFEDNPSKLRKDKSNVVAAGNGNTSTFMQQLNLANARGSDSTQRFSINDLAPLPKQYYPTPRGPPTPPTDEDDADAMDWTPSKPSNLRPTSIYRPVQSEPPPQASPLPRFRGRLPPNILSPAQRLRNPQNQPTFRKASETQKQKFFRTPKQRPIEDADASESGTDPEDSPYSIRSPMKIADPKFFPSSDYRSETGLEAMLENSFFITEEAVEVRGAPRPLEKREVQLLRDVPRSVRRRSVTIMLLMAALALFIWHAAILDRIPALRDSIYARLRNFLALP